MEPHNRPVQYPPGICFECMRCALCCGDTRQHARRILLIEKEARQISEATLKPMSEFLHAIVGHEPYVYEMKKSGGDGRCFFLEGNVCRVYEHRPLVCRFYPFELKTAADGTSTFRHADECPGIGKGQPLDEAYFRELVRLACETLGEDHDQRRRSSPS